MQFDDTALKTLDRKYARIAALGWGKEALHELPRFVRWMRSSPMLRAYLDQIVRMHDAEEAALARDVNAAIERFGALGKELREIDPDAALDDGGWASGPEYQKWQWFKEKEDELRDLTTDLDGRSFISGRMGDLLLVRAADVASRALKDKRDPEVLDICDRADKAALVHRFRLQDAKLSVEMSPRTALIEVLSYCRAMTRYVEAQQHWTDFAPRDFAAEQSAKIVLLEVNPNTQQTLRALERVIDELHTLASGPLSYRALIGRFKERCVLFDKSRMREIANAQKPGTEIDAEREDRLTLELAKYLHDAGVYVLARARFGTHQPDAVGLEGLAIEAKAYRKNGNPKGDITGAYAQLHAYMTGLENGPFAPTEGFVVTFRLDGPIYTLPDTIEMGRHRIHSFLVDIGDAADSGRYQSAPIPISEEEILTAIKKPKAPKKAASEKSRGKAAAKKRAATS